MGKRAVVTTKHVLLVEDDVDIAEPYIRALESDGETTVTRVDHAQAAIDCVDESGDIRLVVLDLFLPEHNGFAVLQHLQSYADWQSIPVLLLSSYPRRALRLSDSELAAYGVCQFLDKTATEPSTLKQVVHGVLRK